MHRRDLADQNSKYIPFLEGDLLVEITIAQPARDSFTTMWLKKCLKWPHSSVKSEDPDSGSR